MGSEVTGRREGFCLPWFLYTIQNTWIDKFLDSSGMFETRQILNSQDLCRLEDQRETRTHL